MKLSLKRSVMLIILIAISVVLLLNYLVSLKINSLFFKKLDSKSGSFTNSYNSIELVDGKTKADLYFIPNPSSKIYVLYIPSNMGILNNALNTIVTKYNLFAINYPKEKSLQNFASFAKISELAIREITSRGIPSENIIIFGQGVGANVALKVSETIPLKSVLILNILEGERKYCNTYFFSGLCLFIKNTLSFQSYNQNLIYYFFNEGQNAQNEENYEIFNQINANDKFFFEISGTDANFNFNQIIDFYNNENSAQGQSFDVNNISELPEGEYIIENDGLLGDGEYID